MVANKTIGRDISLEEFDRRFDEGESILDYVDMSTIRRPNLELKRTSVQLPVCMINELDRQARRLGITRQALIKIWIAEKLG